jgi:hypothetical protein
VPQQDGRHGGVQARVERTEDGAGHRHREVQLAHRRDILGEHHDLHTVQNKSVKNHSILSETPPNQNRFGLGLEAIVAELDVPRAKW